MENPSAPAADTQLTGLFAAVVTPVDDDGTSSPRRSTGSWTLRSRPGSSGICIAGATGEYPHFETDDRKRVIRRAAARLPADRALLVGIGAPSLRHAIELGEVAIDAGSRALLLPMPMFFRYEQADLAAFCAQVSRALRAPCLLYNLPGFTNGLSVETMLGLLRDEAFVAGVKDSSGEAGNLPRSRAVARQRAVVAAGRRRSSADRGTARGLGRRDLRRGGLLPRAAGCALPQLSSRAGGTTPRGLQALLDELIDRIAPFPTPWGIRIGLAARGLPTGPLPLPLTPIRRQQIAAFTAWFPDWLQRTGIASP